MRRNWRITEFLAATLAWTAIFATGRELPLAMPSEQGALQMPEQGETHVGIIGGTCCGPSAGHVGLGGGTVCGATVDTWGYWWHVRCNY